MREVEFKGKVAVVTGAASGMGLLTAQEFARLGASVVLCDVNAAALDAAALQFEAAGGLYVTARTAPAAFDALPSGLNKMMFDFGDQLPDRGIVFTVPSTVPVTVDDFAVTVKCTHPKFKSDCFSVKVKTRGDVTRVEYSLKTKGLVVFFM